jgi:4-hydroxybenzoate polyprenyltransferase
MVFTDFNYCLIEKIPEQYRPYAVLARVDRPVGIWLLLLPGWWAIVLAGGGLWRMTLWDWYVFLLFGIGAMVMRGAGCVINDLWDRKLDAQVERTRMRPLASGEISTRQAVMFLTLLLVIGALILVQMNTLTIVLGILTLPLMVAYPYMKRITWWPQLFLGIVFNFGALMGWTAITGKLGFAPLYLYAGGILWTLGYDTIYAHQDKEDDALAGIKSTARLFGENSKNYVALFFAGAWILIAAGAVLADFHSMAFLFLLPALLHFIWQIWAWDMNSAESSLKIFRSNVVLGWMVLAAFAFA